MKSNFYKSVKNITISMICQITTLILSFVSRSIFIHYLSSEYLGVSGLFSNILTLLSFSELGLGNVMVFSLYEPIKKNDKVKIRALLELYKKSYRVIAITILIIGCLINPFILNFISGVPNIKENIHLLFLLYLLNTVFSYLCTYKKSLLSADQKMYVINVMTSILHIVLLFVQAIFLYITKSFIIYLIVQIVFTLLINISISLKVDKEYKDIFDIAYTPLSKSEINKIFTNIRALTISRISGIVSSGTDNIIISKMFGLTPVGLVSNYIMIINSVNNIVYGALTSMISSIGNFNVDSTIEKKRKIFDELFFTVYIIYSFVCVCVLVLAQPFIELWIGEKFVLPFSILVQLVLGIYVSGVNYPIYSFRTTMGFFKEVRYIYVFCAILNIFLSILLGQYFGVMGIFMATWVSKLFITETADSYFSYKIILKRKWSDYFFKYFLYLSLVVLNYLVTVNIVSLINIYGFFGFLVKAMVCVLTNVITNVIIFYRCEEFKSIFKRIIGMVRK